MIARLRSGMPAATSSAAGRERDHHGGAEVRLGGDEQAGAADDHAAAGARARAGRARAGGGGPAASAAYSTSASLSSSEGWNWSGPGPIQRRAPLIADAHVGDVHGEHERERDGQQRRDEALHFGDPVARQHAHRDEPDRAVDDELDQVASCRCPSPAAARWRRRRCRPSPRRRRAGTGWRSAGCDARSSAQAVTLPCPLGASGLCPEGRGLA